MEETLKVELTTKAVYYERKNPKAEIWIYSDSNEPTWLTQQIEIGMLHNVVNSWLNS